MRDEEEIRRILFPEDYVEYVQVRPQYKPIGKTEQNENEIRNIHDSQ